ncbi:MAG: VTT domain-containing protein [Candidatus Sumerlaeaceae bacterium]|nr:VTT domain-containing protein [Candidatus Sumerlaeaceae bacterium]
MNFSQHRKRLVKDAIRVAIVCAIFGATAYVLSIPHVREEILDIAHVRNSLRAAGPAGMLFFIGISGLAVGFGVPRLWVSALAGGLYGAILGTVTGQVASMIGAIITFYIARLLLRSVLLRRMPAKMYVWYERFNKHGFFWLFYIRLFPFANATVTNLVGGVSQVSLRTFLLATFLGYLPETAIFAVFGSSAAKKDYVQFAVAFAALVAFLTIERFWQYLRKRGGVAEDPSVVACELERESLK